MPRHEGFPPSTATTTTPTTGKTIPDCREPGGSKDGSGAKISEENLPGRAAQPYLANAMVGQRRSQEPRQKIPVRSLIVLFLARGRGDGDWVVQAGQGGRENRIETLFLTLDDRPRPQPDGRGYLKPCREVVACVESLPRSLLEFRSEMRHWHDSWFASTGHLAVPRQLFSLLSVCGDLRTRRIFEPTCLAYHTIGNIHGLFVPYLDLASCLRVVAGGGRSPGIDSVGRL